MILVTSCEMVNRAFQRARGFSRSFFFFHLELMTFININHLET